LYGTLVRDRPKQMTDKSHWQKLAKAKYRKHCVEYEMQKLFDKKKVIFHNAKFDLAMLEYHFGFKFPRIEDTMLMHYMLNENPGTHGLKQLALKHTKYGNYERELEDFITGYCKRNGVLKAQFTWDMVPSSVSQLF